MKRKSKLPELLSPAGDFDCLLAAVAGGADAVYVGGLRFGARAFAKNFDIDTLSRAVSYCHLHGVKLYVTVNTLVYDRELSELCDYAAELYRVGVDALIVADLGVIREIRKRLPDFELHASTQMSVHNTLGADMAAELGCSRVVLARELSREDTVAVTEACRPEVEVFLHGALCVCHSGQCLFSSLVGGRSGNRGECAQPCRLPYNGGKYPLSLTDLSLAGHVTELISSGVASLKIEGRMKSPDYVYTVTRIYRRLLDEERNATPDEVRELERVFSRSGFTDGYFTGKPQSKMTGVRSEEDKKSSRESISHSFAPERISVRAKVVLRLGEPSVMTLTDGARSVTVTGDVPVVAERAPLTADGVKERLSKMGNTFLSLSQDDIDLTLDEGVNLSPAALNRLRRDAAGRFEYFGREIPEKRDTPPALRRKSGKNFTTALFLDSESYLAVKGSSEMENIDLAFLPLFTEDAASADGVYLPPVIMEHELCEVRERICAVAASGVKYALVGNIGHVSLVRQYGLIPIGDFRLNVTNSSTAEVYGDLGIDALVLSPELTLPQARDIGGATVVYGRIPLMLTERCFMKESFGCDKCGKCALTDRKGEKFPMMREYRHRNLILNSHVTYMGDRRDELRRAGLTDSHLIFSTESPKEIRSALAALASGKPLAAPGVRRMGKR